MQKWKPIFHLKNSQLIKKEDGVTLLELLASIALLSIIIMLVGSVHMFGQRQYIKQSHDASQANELAAGISAMTRTLRPLASEKVIVNGSQIMLENSVLFELSGNDLESGDKTIIAHGIEGFTALKTDNGKAIEISLTAENEETYWTKIYFRGD